MEPMVFASFYIFSFAIFLMGVHKNSWTLSFSGSLLLVLFSSVSVILSQMNVSENTIFLNVSDESGSNPITINARDTAAYDPYMFSFALIMGVFSCFFMLYSLLYLRNKSVS